jgi:predicted Fe-Mo cluster-binding NifX family protein
MTEQSVIIACATNDKKELVNDHFGEATWFMLFKLSKKNISEIKSIKNKTASESEEEEHSHGAAKKAKAIIEHFKSENVDIFLSRQFGPNIKRIKKEVLPVIIRGSETIKSDLELCRTNFDTLLNRLAEPADSRKHLVFTKN